MEPVLLLGMAKGPLDVGGSERLQGPHRPRTWHHPGDKGEVG